MRFRSASREWREALIRRLDRIAAWTNPVLMIVAAYLLILDLSCVAALAISEMHGAQSNQASGPLARPTAIGPRD
jgi:hypothetical protein